MQLQGSLAQRTAQTILDAFSSDELTHAVQSCPGEHSERLTADKALAEQAYELLDQRNRHDRAQESPRRLLSERPVSHVLAGSCAETERRQAQEGAGRPTRGRVHSALHRSRRRYGPAVRRPPTRLRGHGPSSRRTRCTRAGEAMWREEGRMP